MSWTTLPPLRSMAGINMLEPHRNSALVKHLLQVADSVFGEVKDRRRERRIGAPVDEHLGKMLERAGASGCDHRNRHGARHRGSQLAIESALRAVAIDRGQQNFA